MSSALDSFATTDARSLLEMSVISFLGPRVISHSERKTDARHGDRLLVCDGEDIRAKRARTVTTTHFLHSLCGADVIDAASDAASNRYPLGCAQICSLAEKSGPLLPIVHIGAWRSPFIPDAKKLDCFTDD